MHGRSAYPALYLECRFHTKAVSKMSKQRITAASKRVKKQERREEEYRQTLKRRQRNRNTLIVVLVAAVAIIASLVYFVTRPQAVPSGQAAQTNTSSATTPANSSSSSAFAPINGVSCDNSEHLDYHHHVHLSVYINGQPAIVPQNIGINPNTPSPCIYWLHTHDTSGVVHIEAPAQRTFTLGNFFDVWSQRFAQLGFPSQLSQTSGWQVYVNGQAYKGDFHTIPMDDHTLITLAYNSPGVKPETSYNWNGL